MSGDAGAVTEGGRGATVTVQLFRGLAGSTRYQREVVRGLGLRRVGDAVARPDNAMTRGMLRKVPHMVRIVAEGEAE